MEKRIPAAFSPAVLLFLLFTVTAAAQTAGSNAAPLPPNIVLILADDLDSRLNALEYTPNIKSLMSDHGVTFTNCFVPLSLCCPSRSTILTGLLPHDTQVWTNHLPDGGWEVFHEVLESTTIATLLHDSGYRTVLMGKYLNDYPDPNDLTFVPPGWDEWYSPAAGDPYSEYNYTLNENGSLVVYGSAPADFMVDVLASKAVDFIDRMAQAPLNQKPFFMYIATYAPHTPATPAPRHLGLFPDLQAPRPPSFNEPDVSDKPAYMMSRPILTAKQVQAIDDLYRKRIQAMQSVDDLVAEVVQALTANGQIGNTYIIFDSDNAFHMGEHRMDSWKYTPYQEDIHVPMIIRGPGVPWNVTRPHLVADYDLAPTFADMAGLPPGSFPVPVDGRSLLPLLSATPPSETAWRQAFFLEEGKPGSATAAPTYPGIHSDNFQKSFDKILEPPDPADFLEDETIIPPYKGFQTHIYKYVEYETGETELYNLVGDPFELTNQAAAADPALIQSMSNYLEPMKTASGNAFRSLEALSPPPLSDPATLTIDPADTDPAIDNWLEPHIVCINRGLPGRGLLFVFLPGTSDKPESYRLLLEQIANSGCPAIGLCYPNTRNIANFCSQDEDRDCHEKARMEVFDGIHRSPSINVSRANSIENRLIKLLQRLDTNHPHDHWGDFLDNGLPRWESIIIAGQTQGGSQAAIIGKVRSVARVVIFSAPDDFSSYYNAVAPWVSAPGLTFAQRYFGFAHALDDDWAGYQSGWSLLGMGGSGPPFRADSGFIPFAAAHQVYTQTAPALSGEYSASTVSDQATPQDGSGQPLYAKIWGSLALPFAGDLDADSSYTGNDLHLLADGLAGNGDSGQIPAGLADMNRDGSVDIVDVLQLRRNRENLIGDLVATDSIVGRLRLVPAGTFTQGSPVSEVCRNNDETQFTHTLTKSLAVMETAVTRQMWADLKSARPALPADPSLVIGGQGMNVPVNDVTWHKAVLFANLLSLQQGLVRCYYTDAGFTTPVTAANYQTNAVYCDWEATGYRLPTEGEREYFTRAGTTGPFSAAVTVYGSGNCDSCDPSPAMPALNGVAWWCANSSNQSQPVGTKNENDWDLRDVHGNVKEWCWDWYGAYPAGPATDFRGPAGGTARAVRGGSCTSTARDCRSACRSTGGTPGSPSPDLGFRLVRSVR